MIRTAIIVGSTRPGRNAIGVAEWVQEHASRHNGLGVELIDLAEVALPHLDEPVPAALTRDYQHAHTREWSATIERFDAFVIVVPEYNHGAPGVLKDAIDFLFEEWHDKAVGFVSYGLIGGVRAVEHLRLIAGEVKMAGVRSQVALSLFDDFEDRTVLQPRPHQLPALVTMLDELVEWGGALKRLRALR